MESSLTTKFTQLRVSPTAPMLLLCLTPSYPMPWLMLRLGRAPLGPGLADGLCRLRGMAWCQPLPHHHLYLLTQLQQTVPVSRGGEEINSIVLSELHFFLPYIHTPLVLVKMDIKLRGEGVNMLTSNL